MSHKITSILLLTIAFQSFAQSEARLLADGTKTDQVVPETTEYTLEFPITELDAKKAFSNPINITKTLDYRIYIGGGDEAYQLDNIYWKDLKKEGYKNWVKLAKNEGVIITTLEGEKINDVFRVLKSNEWPERDFKFKIWITTYANLNGDEVTLSEKWISIPASLRASYMAKDNEETYRFFKSGDASNIVSNLSLAAAIENHMESKWPSEDITTVNIRYFSYKDVSQTTFKFEGYYITQKNGICKYNSCYGNGTNSSGRYSLSFFNSMNAEKSVSCEIAEKLRNR